MKIELSNTALSSAIGAGNKTMVGGAVGSFSGWLLSINWVSVAGLTATLIGLAVSVYFSYLKNKREEKEAFEESLRKVKREERELAEHLMRIRILESQYKGFTPKHCEAAHFAQQDKGAENDRL